MMLADTPLGKATGCDLSQDGDVSLYIQGYGSSKHASYVAAQEVGKNFKELFIGSSISIKNAQLRILNISSNKRKKGAARTGEISVNLKQGTNMQKIKMQYTYLNGHFQAKGKQKDSKEVSFSLTIKALLCYNK